MKNANLLSRSLCVALAIALAVTFAGCGDKAKAGKPEVYKTISDWFTIKVGDRPVQMQLAILPLEMQQGLMGRRDLGPDQGMIFVYPRPDRMAFYMRNTPTPLDIGYFGPDGKLREVYPMHPYDEKTVKSRSDSIQFALEMNQGWYKNSGVRTGAQIDLKALADAVEARGFRSEAFGFGATGKR